MDFVIKLLGLLTSIISLISAIVAVVSSKKSKEKAQQADNIKREMERFYKQYLRDMSNAAQSIAQSNEQKIERFNHEKARCVIKQAICSFQKDYFVIQDVENYLKHEVHIQIDENSVVDILTDLEKSGMIKKLSKNGYHRFA